ncbi:hypothetical protein C8R43DRAFT_73181 [Mycena crocata]|nr:hypothetical protein C8R43DRAFT_73181 [Mycena crocata]
MAPQRSATAVCWPRRSAWAVFSRADQVCVPYSIFFIHIFLGSVSQVYFSSPALFLSRPAPPPPSICSPSPYAVSSSLPYLLYMFLCFSYAPASLYSSYRLDFTALAFVIYLLFTLLPVYLAADYRRCNHLSRALILCRSRMYCGLNRVDFN